MLLASLRQLTIQGGSTADLCYSDTAAVIIGRNESARLSASINSLVKTVSLVVYVDSASSDNSVEIAVSLNVEIVELTKSDNPTAALARNSGYRRILEINPEIQFIQFIDGDCVTHPDWITISREFLLRNPEVAAVVGQRVEEQPQASIYNYLCSLEWQTPAGVTLFLGGDVMMQTKAIVEVSGYRGTMIAGEEPELSVRLRSRGWKLAVLSDEMTCHDANVLRFSQWWSRAMRSGHAYAEGNFLHWRAPERMWCREVLRIWVFGLILPITAIVGGWLFGAWGVLIFLSPHLALVIRSVLHQKTTWSERLIVALFNVLSRFPESLGQLSYWFNKVRGTEAKIIEYRRRTGG